MEKAKIANIGALSDYIKSKHHGIAVSIEPSVAAISDGKRAQNVHTAPATKDAHDKQVEPCKKPSSPKPSIAPTEKQKEKTVPMKESAPVKQNTMQNDSTTCIVFDRDKNSDFVRHERTLQMRGGYAFFQGEKAALIYVKIGSNMSGQDIYSVVDCVKSASVSTSILPKEDSYKLASTNLLEAISKGAIKPFKALVYAMRECKEWSQEDMETVWSKAA